MSDNNNNNDEQNNRSTDSNLPILFANGYPTSLEKMSKEQLEKFIPFLIKCSWSGNEEEENVAPKWWPNYIKFRIPLEKPKKYKKNWENTLRRTVESCYEHHKHSFLLKYSRDLSENEPANLRYVKATETTTFLYSRDPKKLLLTFRNENMLYDKVRRMKLWEKDEAPSPDSELDEIESTFDIMLCDYCDAEFYSDEAFTKHEAKCGEAMKEEQMEIVDKIEISDDEVEEDHEGVQNDFMAYFQLAGLTSDTRPRRSHSVAERGMSPKKKKMNQRARRELQRKEKDREKAIPFSSPAGLGLIKKDIIKEVEIAEGLEYIEEYCEANPNTKIPKYRRYPCETTRGKIKEMRVTRPFNWPKRCAQSRWKEENFKFLNRSLIEKLQPAKVVLEQMSVNQMRHEMERLRFLRDQKEREKTADCVDLCSDSESDSVVLDSDIDLENIEKLPKFLPEQAIMSYQSTSSTSYMFHNPQLPPVAPLTNCNFFLKNHLQPSNSHYQTTFTYSQSTSTPSTSQSPASKRSRENDIPGSRKLSVQQWLQTVNTVSNNETFNMANHKGTIINSQ